MYFTDDSLFPESMQPTIITAAPYGPEWPPRTLGVNVRVGNEDNIWDMHKKRWSTVKLPSNRSEGRKGFSPTKRTDDCRRSVSHARVPRAFCSSSDARRLRAGTALPAFVTSLPRSP